jgi:hypothetical protein
VTGTPAGTGQIWAKSPDGSLIFTNLKVSVKERRYKTVAIHAITEENDDVQVIPVGQGQPGQVCISPGPDGVLNTTAAVGDVRVGNNITTGADGICQTTKAGDDVQVIPVGNGKPNVACVTAGANGFRDTLKGGDDAYVGNFITTGSNGICETTANNLNIASANVPSASSLQAELDDIWGRQANVFCTVTRSDYTVNYDTNRNAKCDAVSGTLAGERQLIVDAAGSGADIDVYFVQSYQLGGGSAAASTLGQECFVGDAHDNSPENISAHEIGHALDIDWESTDEIDVMLYYGSASDPCNVKKRDWDKVNRYN